jgi:hypothetical protein
VKRQLSTIIIALVSITACKKKEVTTEAASAEKPNAAETAKPAAPVPAAAPVVASIEYKNADPSFSIKVPSGFVATAPIQTGPGIYGLRLSKPGEESGVGTFVSVEWWTSDHFEGLSKQLAMGEAGATVIAKSKTDGGTFVLRKTADNQLEGESVIRGAKNAFLCRVRASDPAPEFMRACETFTSP